MGRSRASLNRLLEMATTLGFQDDIDHWTAEIKKLDDEEQNNG
jgi:hypothetical protein